jgi:hypothetical protein
MAVLNNALITAHLQSLGGGQSIGAVTQLKLTNKNITRISDISAAKSLRRLDLTGNELTGNGITAMGHSLAAIATSLDYLILNENNLTSLDGIESCTRIKVLQVCDVTQRICNTSFAAYHFIQSKIHYYL